MEKNEFGVEVIDLRSIVLETITPDEYKAREEFWGDRRDIGSGCICSKIKNPIRDDDYVRLLYALAHTDEVFKVDIRFGPGEWLHRSRIMLTYLPECKLAAEVLRREPIKRNYFDILVVGKGSESANIDFGE